MGGKEVWFDMYRKRSEMIREGVKEMGFGIFVELGYESFIIIVVVVLEGMKGVDVYNVMCERGFEFVKGYGSVVEKIFCIGNMGYMIFDDIRDRKSVV